MQINKWPPPNDVHSVIALFEDVWCEVNKNYITDVYEWVGPEKWRKQKIGERPSTWADGYSPITLNYHGCGCCSSTDPEPTHWIPIPEIE